MELWAKGEGQGFLEGEPLTKQACNHTPRDTTNTKSRGEVSQGDVVLYKVVSEEGFSWEVRPGRTRAGSRVDTVTVPSQEADHGEVRHLLT